MPSPLVKKLAEEKGIDLPEADGEDYWKYVVGIFKKSMGVKENDIMENIGPDWRSSISSAKSFDDILTVFESLSLIASKWAFNSYLAKEKTSEKIRDAVALLKSGVEEPEAKYFAISQIRSQLGYSNYTNDEGVNIALTYDNDAMNRARAELFEHYTKRGFEAMSIISNILPQMAAIDKEISEFEERQKTEYDSIKEDYRPKIEEAKTKYLSDINKKIVQLHEDHRAVEKDIMSRRPLVADRIRAGEIVSDQELEVFSAWEKELDKHYAEYNLANKELQTEFRKLYEEFIQPIHDEQLKEMAAIETETDTRLLKERKKALSAEAHQKLIDHILDQSPVSEEQAKEWISQNAILNQKAIAKAKRAGYDPKEVEKDLAEFYRLTGGRIPRIAYATTRNTRSMASPASGNVYVGSGFGKRTFFHELAHLLETDQKILDCAKHFIAKRRESEKVYSLRSLTDNNGYRLDENAYKDDWIDPYVGKVCSYGSEVFSMGMQMLSSPETLLALQEKDPEHLSLMLGVCLSRPYIDEEKRQKLQSEAQKKKTVFLKANDFYKELDAKIAKDGNFWEGHIDEISPYTKYGKTRPSSYTVIYNKDKSSGIYRSVAFKSEKDMKRALYLWIANGKAIDGMFSLSALTYNLQGIGSLPVDSLSLSISELSNKGGT